MADRDSERNGPENPVSIRRPLRSSHQDIDAREPQSSAIRKIAENQIAFLTRLDVMDHDLVSLGTSMVLGFKAVSSKLDALLGLPSMRRREDSAHAIEEMAAHIGQAARQTAQQIADDPDSNLTPDVVGALVNTKVAEALATQREADRVKKLEAAALEVERIAEDKTRAEKERQKEKRELYRLIVSGIVVGVVVAIAAAFVAFGQGRLTGHGEGFAEGKTSAPPAILPVPVPALVAPAPTVPATATTSTGVTSMHRPP